MISRKIVMALNIISLPILASDKPVIPVIEVDGAVLLQAVHVLRYIFTPSKSLNQGAQKIVTLEELYKKYPHHPYVIQLRLKKLRSKL